jgi:hypothetical protein
MTLAAVSLGTTLNRQDLKYLLNQRLTTIPQHH